MTFTEVHALRAIERKVTVFYVFYIYYLTLNIYELWTIRV
jgi:hypothetical protein